MLWQGWQVDTSVGVLVAAALWRRWLWRWCFGCCRWFSAAPAPSCGVGASGVGAPGTRP